MAQRQQQETDRTDPAALSVLSTGIFVDDDIVTTAGIRFASVEDATLYLHALAGRQVAIDSLFEIDAALERLLGLREQLRADVAARASEMAEIRDLAPKSSGALRSNHDDEWDDAVAVLAVASCRSERTVSAELTVADSRARELPATMHAWGEGALTGAHLRTIERAAAPLQPEQRRAFDAAVVAEAVGRTPSQLASAARRLAKDFDEQPLTERHASAFADRGTWITPEADGMATFSILTSSVIAEGMQNRLRLAFKHKPIDDERTIAQFCSDTAASVLLAGEVAEDGCGWLTNITAHVTVTMPATTLTGVEQGRAELPGGQLVDDDTALLLAGSATSYTRLFTDPLTQTAVAADTYQPPLGLRRLIHGRDQTCRFPGCTRVAQQSDLDHTKAWEHGGRTSFGNLAALCRKHHLRKHRLGAAHGWKVRQTSPGVLEWTDPTGQQVSVVPEPVPTAVGIIGTRSTSGDSRGDPPPDYWTAMDQWHSSGESDSDPPAGPPPF